MYNVYYVKDNTQTKTLSYTVKHMVGGEQKFSHTYTEDVWINAPDTIKIQDGSLAQKTYKGYKFDNMDPATVGESVASGTIITLTYVKDNDQTQDTQYTVKYYKGGVEQPNDMLTVTGTAWVNDDPAMIAIAEGGIPAPADKYEGYQLAEGQTYPDAGTKVESGTEYTVNYVARTDLTYTVKYLEKDTNKKLHDPKIVDKQTFGAEVTEKAIDITGYDKVEPSEQKFTINADKNEITFYYTARTDLKYTVNYLEKDTGKELAKPKTVENQTFGTAVTEKAIFIKGYWPCNPAKETIIIDVDENVINFYYGPYNNPRFPQVSDDTSSTTNTGALKSPKTGDASNLSLWFALLFVSGGVLMGTAVIGRKRKYNR